MDFAVHALHFVIIEIASQYNVSNMLGANFQFQGSKLLIVRFMKVSGSV
jgi:hypothetical protein